MISTITVEQCLEINEWQIAEIKKGITEADAGKFVEHKKIKREWRRKTFVIASVAKQSRN